MYVLYLTKDIIMGAIAIYPYVHICYIGLKYAMLSYDWYNWLNGIYSWTTKKLLTE